MSQPAIDDRVGCGGSVPCAAIDELPAAYMEVDVRGTVVYANREARVMHERPLDRLVGQPAWALMPAGEREGIRLAFEAAMMSGKTPPVVLRTLWTNRNEYRTYEVHRRLIFDASGRPAGMRVVSFDVTEMETEREDAQHLLDWVESVLQSMPEAVLVIDALGFVRYLNPAAEALIGWRNTELEGALVEHALPLVCSQSNGASELNFRTSMNIRWKGVAVVLDRKGHQLTLEISTSPLLNKSSGSVAGVVSLLRSRRPQE